MAYRRWRAELVTNAELCRAMLAAEAGQRAEGARSAWRMALTLLGLPTYRWLVAAAWARAAAGARTSP